MKKPAYQMTASGLPLVSLVTPCFNAGRYLGATIESVLGQDYPNIEYLIMDGGSTDGTLALLNGYGSGVRWFSERDKGQADALAKGFEKTNGSILGWLNADDVLKPGAIRHAVEAFRQDPRAALVYGNADFIDASSRIIGRCTVVEPPSKSRLLNYGDYIIQPAAFFTRMAYEAVGGLDTSLYWTMDWDLWIRLAQRFEMKHIEVNLASYRWLGSNKTAEGGGQRLEEVEMVARRYGCKGLPAYFRLEQARLFSSLARQDLKRLRLLSMLENLARSVATIGTSWRAAGSLLRPHIWKNYRTAQKLYRQSVQLNYFS